MSSTDAFLETVRNLAVHHREHEKYYAAAPLEDALALQRTSRALKALAERWATEMPAPRRAASPYAGAPDINDARATETAGVLFMEGEAQPAEITRMRRDLAELARSSRQTAEWLGTAMETAWDVAENLLRYPKLADLLGERHRIITNDAMAAAMARLVALQLERAGAVLDRVDFSPAALRADLEGDRSASRYAFAASELIDHGADLLARSAVLVHENERRWRVFGDRVEQLISERPSPRAAGS